MLGAPPLTNRPSFAQGYLGTAPLGVIYGRGARRPFWVGFAIWAWGYLAMMAADVSLAPQLLRWAYPILVPIARQPERFREVVIPSALLDEPGRFDELSNSVDLLIDGSPIAEAAGVMQARVAGVRAQSVPFTARLTLSVDPITRERLQGALAEGKQFTVRRHQRSALSQWSTSPPVNFKAFTAVGHAVIGLLAGLVGGGIARAFQARQEIR